MRFPRVPMQFVGGIAEFRELAISLQMLRGTSRPDAEQEVDLVPEVIREAPCFLDRMTGLWLYDFGEPIVLGNRPVFGGGRTWHQVTRLIDVISCAHVRLKEEVLVQYLSRLADPRKHADMLFEFAPILRLPASTDARYEAEGHSPGNRRIDWLIEDGYGFGVLLEVKAREADLIRLFEQIGRGGDRGPAGQAQAPNHDTDILFRSVEEKFLPRSKPTLPQGVWINTALQQEVSQIQGSFEKLDRTRVHFAVLGNWDDGVHLLSRDDVPRGRILALLCVREVDRLVYNLSNS